MDGPNAGWTKYVECVVAWHSSPVFRGRTKVSFPSSKVSDFNLPGNEAKVQSANHWVNTPDLNAIAGKTFPKGSVVFAKIGEALKHNRKRILVRSTFIDNNLMGVVPDTGRVTPDYLFHLFRTIDIAAFDVGTAVPYVKAGTLNQHIISIPPIDAQHRIASILGAYDDLIEVNRRRVALLEGMARGLFEEWFVRFRFPGHEAVPIVDTPDGPLPEGWKWARFGDLVAEVRDGVDPSSVEPTTPYLGLEHLPRRSTTLTDNGRAGDVGSLKLRFQRGDVLFGKIRPYFHKVVWAPYEGVASSDAIIYRPCTASSAAMALAVAASDAFVAMSVQTSNGTKMPRANPAVLRDYRVATDAGQWANAHHAAVMPMIELCASLAASNERLAASRDLLLPRLLSGHLSVAAATRELADAA